MSTLLHENLCRKKHQNTLTKFVQKIEPKQENPSQSDTSALPMVTESSKENIICQSHNVEYADIETPLTSAISIKGDNSPFKKNHDVHSYPIANCLETTEEKKNYAEIQCQEDYEKLQESGFSTAHLLSEVKSVPDKADVVSKKLLIENNEGKISIKQFRYDDDDDDDDIKLFQHLEADQGHQPGDDEKISIDYIRYDIIPHEQTTTSEKIVKANRDQINNVNEDLPREITDDNFNTKEVSIQDPGTNSSLIIEEIIDQSEVENSSGLQEPTLELNMCPVCEDVVNCDSLSQFNQHIDVCLNRKIVMDCSRYRPENDGKLETKSVLKRSNATSCPSSKSKSPKSTGKKKLQVPKSPLINKLNNKSVKSMSKNDIVMSESSGQEPNVCISNDDNVAMATTSIQEDHGKLVCPVCFMEQTGSSLEEFNSHVDTCLSRGIITEILREQKDTDSDRVKRSVIMFLSSTKKQKNHWLSWTTTLLDWGYVLITDTCTKTLQI